MNISWWQRWARLLGSFSFLMLLTLGTVRGQVAGAVMKTDLMGVFAHPDDETGVASTLASYALGRGKTVANIYCTRGEGGGNMVGTQSGAALGYLRESELRSCLEKLGVKYCYFLERRDFAYTESLSATFERWNKDETLKNLVRMIRLLRPEVIVTMDPAPTAGQHGNHQAAGVLATEAFAAAADPARFPTQLSQEGLHIWQVKKLYFSGGGDGGVFCSIPVVDPLPDGRQPWQVAAQASSYHRSQGFGQNSDPGAMPWRKQAQIFRLVKSVVPGRAEQDLFEGLPVSSDFPTPIRLAGSNTPALTLAFQSRPALAAYQKWTRDQDIEGVARRLPADLAVVAGEPNEIKLTVNNGLNIELAGEVSLVPPSGWTVRSSTLAYRLPPGRSSTLLVRLTPPAEAWGPAALTASTRTSSGEVTSRLALNVVPVMKASHPAEEPALDGSDRGWEGIPYQAISEGRRWEGKVRDAADSSAQFRVATRGKTLFLDVLVNDDMVVTNIAPDDIKGHWRSDSVELCFDPTAGAEHTMGCYKLGIFPFDTSGVVKAARDADANPGPIAITAPKTRLTSHRTPRGYRILAAIPWNEIGIPFARRIGFNVLVYDGDSPKAALGENINKSRIAWAPRSGVQGRPEDWGRLDLE